MKSVPLGGLLMGGESGFILLRIDDDPGKGIKLLPMLVFQKLFIEQFKIGFIPCIGFADKFNALRGSVDIAVSYTHLDVYKRQI